EGRHRGEDRGARARGRVGQAHRDGGGSGLGLLRGRGLSPGILPPHRRCQSLLHRGGRAQGGEVQEEVLHSPEADLTGGGRAGVAAPASYQLPDAPPRPELPPPPLKPESEEEDDDDPDEPPEEKTKPPTLALPVLFRSFAAFAY